MKFKYCVEQGVPCEHLEKRPIMAETHMDSGEYIQTGWRFYCNKYDVYFSMGNEKHEDMELQQCFR